MPANDAPDLSTELAMALRAVREAGGIGLARFRKKVQVRHKPDGTPVTEVDLAIDALLRERLLAAFSKDGWLSEEGERTHDWLFRHRVWIVDPLDGTGGFLRGEPFWCIALALVIDHIPVLGIIHAPALGQTWHAVAGQGAFRNDTSIHVSNRGRLDGACIIGPMAVKKPHCWIVPWPEVKVQRYPSLALRLAFVADAAGAHGADAMLALGQKNYWDVAAGDILVREAGGIVADTAGAPLRYDNETVKVNGIMAAGAKLFDQVLTRARGFRCGGRKHRKNDR